MLDVFLRLDFVEQCELTILVKGERLQIGLCVVTQNTAVLLKHLGALGEREEKCPFAFHDVRLRPGVGLLDGIHEVGLEAVVRAGVKPVAVPFAVLVPVGAVGVKQCAAVRRADQ